MVGNTKLSSPISLLLDKEKSDFTRNDMLKLVKEQGVERFTFHYTGLDGQLKELKLPISDLNHAQRVLASGERVDGSSLFKGLVDSSLSDLYVVPVYRTAFLSPFDSKSLDFMCRYMDRSGNLSSFPPDNILYFAHERFKKITGMELHALGEMEFFLIGDSGPEPFTPQKQTGYHAASPFFKSGYIVDEMVRYIVQITGAVKYAHSEVGFIESIRSNRSLLKGRRAEQHEIEMLTRPIEEMGDHIALAKWVIRNVAYKHGMLATFAPKIEEGVAGNGLHFHMELVKDGKNIMINDTKELSDHALKLIGGLAHYASTLSAFGNTIASAFLRLVPNHEAPTRICWSHSNRSAMIRVPLGWAEKTDLAKSINPKETEDYSYDRGLQTVEIRSPDGSANFHLLLAGLTIAAEHGLTEKGMLELAQKTQVSGNIFENKELLSKLEPLPTSCVSCAKLLEKKRALYEKNGIFPPSIIDYEVALLKKEDDEKLNENLSKMTAEERLMATRKIMHGDIHHH